MKRTLILLAVLFLLLGVFVQASLAYSYVQGCVVDGKTGQPWTHGGKVTLDGGVFGTKTTTLDANGCFGPAALPTSQFGNPEVKVIIDLDPAPGGDPPPEQLCTVPKDNTSGPDAIYDCGTMTDSVGPNAILLMKMGASPETGSPLATIALAGAGLLAILGLGVFWRRRNVM